MVSATLHSVGEPPYQYSGTGQAPWHSYTVWLALNVTDARLLITDYRLPITVSYGVILVPVIPLTASSSFSGVVIIAVFPPPFKKDITALILGAILPSAK